MYIIGTRDLPGDVFLFLSIPRCYGAVACLVLSFELLLRDLMPRLCLSIHAITSNTFRRTYWSRFLQAQLRYIPHILSFIPFCILIDYHLQFEEVGSHAAGEAMDEQADTERTETKRASHTQHAEPVQGKSLIGTTLGDISLLDCSMYYWAPAVQAPIEQHISFDATRPPSFSPLDASHVSIFHYFICTN